MDCDLAKDDQKPKIQVEQRVENACERLLREEGHFVDIQLCFPDLVGTSPIKISLNPDASGTVPIITAVTSSGTNARIGSVTTSL